MNTISVAFERALTKSLDEPKHLPGTLDTCQEKDEIDARANRKSNSPSSCNDEGTFSFEIRKKQRLGRTKTATKTVLETLP